MKLGIFAALPLLLTAGAGIAQGNNLFEIARANGGCAGRVMLSAEATSENTITVTCGGPLDGAAPNTAPVTNIVPVLGGLGPLFGIGAAGAAAAVLSGGSSTSDTQ